jgi:hypothetical protein
MNMNWTAAPILAQRGYGIHSIEATYDDMNSATVYTVHEATGKIGVFSIPTKELAPVAEKGEAAILEFLKPYFAAVEFTDGQSAVPQLQPELSGEPADEDQPRGNPEAIDADGATEPSPVDAPDSQPETAVEGQESDA